METAVTEEGPPKRMLPVTGRDAHHVTLPSWVPEGVFDAAVEADQFRGFNGVRTNAASAKLELDANQKLVAKRDEEITLEDRGSTALTMFGSFVALGSFLWFIVVIWWGWTHQEPVIDELERETFNAKYTMPDIAITLNFEGSPSIAGSPKISPPGGGRHWKEGAVMDYMWPEFAWAEFKDGMTNRSDKVTLLESKDGVRFGDACGLDAGYQKGFEEKYKRNVDSKKKVKGVDRGSATWPVFCLLNSEREQGRLVRELEGRFGDPMWAALSLSINSCNGSKLGLSQAFEAEWFANGNGTCADTTNGFAPPSINVWFRFRQEDWAKSGRLKPARGGMLHDKDGPLHDDQQWTWFIYETLSNEAWNRPVTGNIDLRFNTAQVHGKRTVWDSGSGSGETTDSFQALAPRRARARAPPRARRAQRSRRASSLVHRISRRFSFPLLSPRTWSSGNGSASIRILRRRAARAAPPSQIRRIF